MDGVGNGSGRQRCLGRDGVSLSQSILHSCVNVVHVFPYTPRVSGGHSNAIRSFIACQRAKEINAVGIAPKADEDAAETSWEFPLIEVDSLWNLHWETIAEQFAIAPGSSLINFHSVNRRFSPLVADLLGNGL